MGRLEVLFLCSSSRFCVSWASISSEKRADGAERAYADATGRKHQTVRNDIFAAEVSQTCADVGAELSRHFSQLVEIHPASKWLWPGLVNAMLGAG